jgi:OmpA-OmpF porin, OOP family
MKSSILTAILSGALWVAMPVMAQKITTARPFVQKQSQDYVVLTKVELTPSYTILYFTYENQRRRRGSIFDLLEGNQGANNDIIQFNPQSRLYEPQRANRKFKFIKAEGIPLSPDKMRVYPGDKVSFVVYFERLEPGIELFDLYEGKDEGSLEFWNFYGVHIRNPKNQPKPQPKKAEPPVVVEKPVEPAPAPVTAPEPAPVSGLALATVRGTVLNAKTKQPIAAKINYTVPNDDNGLDSLQLSASSGKFRINVPPNQKYNYEVSAKGYLPTTGAFDLSKTAAGQETSVEVLLTPVAVGEAITLNNVYFDVSKYELLPTSYAELDRLVAFMQDNPRIEVRVEGHTDNLGDFDENVKLSQNRANAVKQYLVSKGIDSVRIEAKGYGSTRPVSKGTSEAERRRNRRVELAILKL